MLEKRDPSYRPAAKIESTDAPMDARELYDAIRRIERLNKARTPMVIEGAAEEIMDLDRRGLLTGEGGGLPGQHPLSGDGDGLPGQHPLSGDGDGPHFPTDL